MLLYHWFAKKEAPKPYSLPDPNKELSDRPALEVEAVNQCVEKELIQVGRKKPARIVQQL